VSRWTRAIAIVVTLACFAVVAGQAATAEPPPEGRAATPQEREEIANQFARMEPGWRRDAARAFPGDRWSADDHFHSFELRLARQIAGSRGLRLTDVLMAIDEGLRREYPGSPGRKPGAAPCKPRPFYD